jgi:serine/threonine protein kinase
MVVPVVLPTSPGTPRSDTNRDMHPPPSPLARRYEYVGPLKSSSTLAGWIALDAATGRYVRLMGIESEEAQRLEQAVGVRHLHLVSLLEIIHDPSPDAVPADVGLSPHASIAVCEHVYGTTLHRLVSESGPLAPFKAVAWIIRLIDALEPLHRHGVAHGTVSPRSVIAAPKGRVIPPVLSQLSAPALAGYCSPELLRGGELCPADDVWALHATLYRSVTGRAPFDDESAEALINSITKRGVLPLSRHGIRDPELDRLLVAGLDPNAGTRTTALGELRRALDRWERGEKPVVTPRSASMQPVPRFRTLSLGGPGLHERRFAFQEKAIPADEGEAASPPPPSVTSRPGAVSPSVHPPRAPGLPSDFPEPIQPRGSALQSAPNAASLQAASMSAARVRSARASIPSLVPFQRKKLRWPWIALSWVLAGAVVAYVLLQPRYRSMVGLPGAAPVPTPLALDGPPRGRAAVTTPKQTLAECVASYFPKDTFRPDQKFEFLCADADFREGSNNLADLVAERADAGADASSARTEAPPDGGLLVLSPLAKRFWDLSWYGLAAAAVVRQGCCTNPPAIDLPQTKGWCPQLEKLVRQIGEESRKPIDLSPTVRLFDQAISCLYANKIAKMYYRRYEGPPTQQHRVTFELFLKAAAEKDARRSAIGSRLER